MGKEQYSEERLSKLSYTKFVRLLGVGRVIFNAMVQVIQKKLTIKHLNKKGRKPKYGVREMVIIFLLYIKQYNAMEDYAFEWNISKSVICEYIHFVLEVLLEDKNFTLMGGKSTINDSSENRLLDVTEIRIERPKYNQKSKYSGKKKYHTMKIQIIKGTDTGFIYEIQIGLGSEHDFHLFKRTFKGTSDNVTYTADLGYLGINKIHANSKIPKKQSKNHSLTEEDIKYNKELGADRIFIEHTNGWIKRFKILGSRFRNNLNFFAPFSVLICAFYNFYIAWFNFRTTLLYKTVSFLKVL